ncbi:MAG: hypothetical protein M1824_006016 [Vezdaea acicularis]|nr:MAG: hypothetical protein M1824_006016 [Vezdaea acicularis]
MLLHLSDDYELIIRQGPQRARVAGIKEKDGGFFVFGDLSVKVEGDFRLRFSLFELRKFGDDNQVVHLKSIISELFTVYPAKSFPGMSESTFLSRSFGDQGVRLRIRKEPRTLMRKRQAPSSLPDEFTRYPPAMMQDPRAQMMHGQQGYSNGYGGSQDYGGYPPAAKRQRTSSMDVGIGVPYDQRFYQQQQQQQQPQYSTYTQAPQQAQHYNQAPYSAPAGVPQDYSYRPGHNQSGSTSTASPFGSPRSAHAQMAQRSPMNTTHNPNTTYSQQQPRYSSQQMQQPNSIPPSQPHVPQLADPVPPSRMHHLLQQQQQQQQQQNSYATHHHLPTASLPTSSSILPRTLHNATNNAAAAGGGAGGDMYPLAYHPSAPPMPPPSSASMSGIRQPLTYSLPPLQGGNIARSPSTNATAVPLLPSPPGSGGPAGMGGAQNSVLHPPPTEQSRYVGGPPSSFDTAAQQQQTGIGEGR